MKYIIANLKTSMLKDDVSAYLKYIEKEIITPNKIVFAPSSIYWESFQKYNLTIAAQNVSGETGRNFTGAITIEQLKSNNIEYVILGHSEVRDLLNEDDNLIFKKIKLALRNNIKIVLCVGETSEQKSLHNTFKVIKNQLTKALSLEPEFLPDIIVAYEPVWAIGSGMVPNNKEIIEAVQYIKGLFINKMNHDIKVLYGGSVNRNNINNLNSIKDLDGFLVGTASFDAEHFVEVANSVYQSKR